MIEYVQPSSQMISGGCQHQQCEEIFVISKDHFCGFVIDFMLRTESLAEPWISVVNDHAALRAKACETLRQYEVSLLNYGKV